jgi:hypothetical protein
MLATLTDFVGYGHASPPLLMNATNLPDLLISINKHASLSARATIFNASSGRGRCSAFASSYGARIHTSRSSSVVRITGIAFGWTGSSTAFGVVVRKP